MVRDKKAGRVQVVTSPFIEARKKTGLSQPQFAALLGVSLRALQRWEQGPAAERCGLYAAGHREHVSQGCAARGGEVKRRAPAL